MADEHVPFRRHGSLVAPVLLITLGVIFLYAQWHPDFDPWPILWTYWPLILILVGLAKIWDYWRRRQNPGSPLAGPSGGGILAALVLIILFVGLFSHGRHWARWRGNTVYAMQHLERSVDKDDARSVNATIEMGAGDLNLSGGSSHLLEADFDYRASSGTPRVEYSVSGGTGELRVSQDNSDTHINTTSDNHWTLHLANGVPVDLKISMGAGRSNLRLQEINLTGLHVEVGAGQADVDLTGDRKADLTARVEGGVGEANIRLPRNIGVIVNVSGGIGTIEAHGLKHDGDEYTNEAYGKSPVTIHLTVEGGIGRITLTEM